jgi:ClpP class serine protease
VDEIAQGRVWPGAGAAKIGLVDDPGGLDQAIAAAANDAEGNPEGIVSLSPGLRAERYPGGARPRVPFTLKGEWRLHSA